MKLTTKSPIRYQYMLHTWGGFYNKQHNHTYKPGYYRFSTPEMRQAVIDELTATSDRLKARMLVIQCSEGYTCDTPTVLHRVIEYNGDRYYTTYDMGANYTYDAARYHLEYKWIAGFNDYPLGEAFDYTKVTLIQEWISGAFSDLNN